jgi:hypothetical protein
MASWPDAHTVFRHNAQYTLQQNANDDWDYETGAEAGYGLNNFQESTVLSNPTLVRDTRSMSTTVHILCVTELKIIGIERW